jgi:murein DD-endopeptidase MepM/ murein hydrolase activator NlpD
VPAAGGRLGRLLIASATAALTLGGGVASAQILSEPIPDDDPVGAIPPDQPGGQSSDDGAAQAAGGGGTGPGGGGSGGGGGDDGGDGDGGGGGGDGGGGGGDGGGASLKLEDVSPGKIFYSGKLAARFRFEIDAQRSRNLKVEVVDRGNHDVVRDWRRDDVEPGVEYRVSWRGRKDGGGAAPKGRYFFRVRERGGGVVNRSRAQGDRYFAHYPHKFPVRGRHTYGDGIGAGRGHQGQDLFADCGTRLHAARAGKVQFRGYQGSGAGYYLVIDGKSTGRDYVYMHLMRRARAAEGERVKAGELIGQVGESGNASGCHLHFELWSSPGWYEGGHFLDPTPKLKAWDRWS